MSKDRTIFLRNVPDRTWRLAHVTAGFSEFGDTKAWILDAIEKQAEAQLGSKGFSTVKKIINQTITDEAAGRSSHVQKSDGMFEDFTDRLIKQLNQDVQPIPE